MSLRFWGGSSTGMKTALLLAMILPITTPSFFDDIGWVQEKCVTVVGKLDCDIPFYNYEKVAVELFDADGLQLPPPFGNVNPDDRAARTYANADGSFRISGCANDLSVMWIPNHPELYLRVTSQCRYDFLWNTTPVVQYFFKEPDHLIRSYSPKEFDAGVLRLGE